MSYKMILAVNFTPERIKNLKLLALLTKAQLKIVTEEEKKETVGELLGLGEEEIKEIAALRKESDEGTDAGVDEASKPITMEAVILLGFDSPALNLLLNGIRRGPLKNIPLKAGVTPNNITWTIDTILQELAKEYAYFKGQK